MEKPGVRVITGDDIYFILTARDLGFKSYCFTKIKCDHLVREKYKDDGTGNLVHSSFSNTYEG